jgi:hypothetical protein
MPIFAVMEIWKRIKGFETYMVSNRGNVKNKDGVVMSLRRRSRGYPEVILYKNGKEYYRVVHRLVAIAFIPNPENKPQVNHKDLDKLNNDVGNLEWCTNKHNIAHYIETSGFHHASVQVEILKDGEDWGMADSLTEAAKLIGLSYISTCKHFRAGTPTGKGFTIRRF